MHTCFCKYLTKVSCAGIIRKLCSTLQTLPDLRNSYIPDGPAQVGIKYTYVQLYMYTQGSPDEIRTPTHTRELIGSSTTAPPPVLSPSSILPPPSSHGVIIPAKRNLVLVSKTLLCRGVTVLTMRYFRSVVKHIFHRQTFCLPHRMVCV